MSSARRLAPLLKRAQDRQDAAARRMAERQQALETQRQRLAELQQYTGEYLQAPPGAVTPAALLNRQAFLDRLQSAVRLQARNVERHQQLVETERLKLVEASRELKVMQTLQERYLEQERALANRRDQRVLDDLGARIASRTRTEEALR